MILPRQQIEDLVRRGHVRLGGDPDDGLPPTLQPASLDLRVGRTAFRMRASFLPGRGRSVDDGIQALRLHEISLEGGAVLEVGGIYLIPLMESLDLPADLRALANPKSSTGRLDVFARVIGQGSERFDALPEGYAGPLWVEVAPRTFGVVVRPGDRLCQMRFKRGSTQKSRRLTVSVDLSGTDRTVGFRARRHSALVDLRGVGAHDPSDFWEPVRLRGGGLILEPDEFYILASREAVEIPVGEAAEMAAIDTEIGEFRAHYAGFFDPGFGTREGGGVGSRAVLEVRGRDVPFLLRHGQPVAHLVYEPLSERPDVIYGAHGSHYQSQGLRLGKHFRDG